MPGVGARWPDPILTTIDDGTDGTKAKRQEMTSTLTILVSWLTVVSSRGLLTGLVASLAFGAAAALLLTAARSLG